MAPSERWTVVEYADGVEVVRAMADVSGIAGSESLSCYEPLATALQLR